jgi:hypothetical protein
VARLKAPFRDFLNGPDLYSHIPQQSLLSFYIDFYICLLLCSAVVGCLITSSCEVFDVEKYRNYARGHDESLMVNTKSSYLKHLKVLFPYLKLTIRLLVKK